MLELRDITYAAQEEDGAEKEILRGVSLKVDERFVAITGPNGGGKSTLARIIAGIIAPTSGQVLLDGEDITALGVTERARKGISFAFQQPVRFKGITVYDLLRYAAGKKISVGQACDYLARVGMCARDYVNREVNASLSGGELKRIEIATVPTLRCCATAGKGHFVWHPCLTMVSRCFAAARTMLRRQRSM